VSPLSSRFSTLLGTASALVTSAVATAAEPLAAADAGREASLVLAASFIGLALVLRRRVHAGMWASRERAFTRRTVRAERRSLRTRHRGAL